MLLDSQVGQFQLAHQERQISRKQTARLLNNTFLSSEAGPVDIFVEIALLGFKPSRVQRMEPQTHTMREMIWIRWRHPPTKWYGTQDHKWVGNCYTFKSKVYTAENMQSVQHDGCREHSKAKVMRV